MAALTQREKILDKAIEECGIPLNEFDDSESFVRDVMRRIGAKESDYLFVKSRVDLRVRSAALLVRADALIVNTEKTLEQFEKDDKEWERKGDELGIRF